MADPAPRIVGPRDGAAVDLAGFGIRHMIGGDESGGGFSLVEHPMAPRRLAAPMHRHANEDEYSYVLEGRMGAKLGDEVVFAGVAARYKLELDVESIPGLLEEHWLVFAPAE